MTLIFRDKDKPKKVFDIVDLSGKDIVFKDDRLVIYPKDGHHYFTYIYKCYYVDFFLVDLTNENKEDNFIIDLLADNFEVYKNYVESKGNSINKDLGILGEV